MENLEEDEEEDDDEVEEKEHEQEDQDGEGAEEMHITIKKILLWYLFYYI